MKNKNIWMPLYVADYRSKTMRLTTIQHGAYMLLIMEYWQEGRLPCDDETLALIAGMSAKEWAANRPAIARYFNPDWSHDRINEELSKADDLSKKRKESADKRWSGVRGSKVIKFPEGGK